MRGEIYNLCYYFHDYLQDPFVYTLYYKDMNVNNVYEILLKKMLPFCIVIQESTKLED